MSLSFDALAEAWQFGALKAHREAGALLLTNPEPCRSSVHCRKSAVNWANEEARVQIRFKGKLTNGGAALVAQLDGVDLYPIPLGSVSEVSIRAHSCLAFRIEVDGGTTLQVLELTVESVGEERPGLFHEYLADGRVLLVTPTYPSSNNLYLSGFTHARVRLYRQQGLEPIVFCAHFVYACRTVYEHDGVRVLRGNLWDLLGVLDTVEFQKILVHFFDELYAHVLDRARKNRDRPVILWCHGPETLFREMPRLTRPYFAPPSLVDAASLQKFESKDHYVAKYASLERVSWVFVSEWLRAESERLLGFAFQRSYVIPNPIDNELFAYIPKKPEARKRVFVLRRYDNENKYAVDLSVRTILELARRPGFPELEFHFFGDGNYYEELLGPLRHLKNVVRHRRFLSQEEIGRIHRDFGIALFPSRHDTQGVSALEAASSGLVVISSAATAIPEYLPRELGTLATGEDPSEYADIVERFVRDSNLFQQTSRKLAEHVRRQCSPERTITKELELIGARGEVEGPSVKGGGPRRSRRERGRLLTVVVPTYNMEAYLERCVASLLECNSRDDLEVLVVDDGSKDRSLEVGRALEKRYSGIVRVIAKANGGHGSTINCGLAQARGRYFKILDSDDWVDSRNFARLVDRLSEENADLVLTDYAEDWPGHDLLVHKSLYSNLMPNQRYDFDTLADPVYGFRGWGPILATSSFKTECLRRSKLWIDEKMSYVDMEYNTLSLTFVDSVRYYDLSIYRYTLGRSEQTVSREGFRRKYKDHERVILRISDFIVGVPELSEGKRRYVVHNILAPLIDSQYLVLNEIVGDPAETHRFDARIRVYPFFSELKLKHCSVVRPANSVSLHRRWVNAARRAAKMSLPYEVIVSLDQEIVGSPSRFVRHMAKFVVPYGLVVRYQNKKRRGQYAT